MKKLHEKSPCCGANFVKFGGKRRRCKKCGKTWTAWPRKRGRKKKRVSKSLAINFLQHAVGSAFARSKNKPISSRTMTRDITRSRNLFCSTTSWPKLPEPGPLILVADAVIKKVGRKHYTAYCMFVRSPKETEATILPPVIFPGGETQPMWRLAINSLPTAILPRIRAIVCDGHRGTVNYAKNHKWIIQRCQFHLIAAIQGRRSRWKHSRHRKEAEYIFNLVHQVLKDNDEVKIPALLLKIEDCALSTTSKELRRVLLGFVNNYEDFRNYFYHPELNLPTTTNTAESFISSIEELCHRLRGFPTLESFEKWIEALTKYRRKIKCNGCHQQKN